MTTTTPPLPPSLLHLANSYIQHTGGHETPRAVAENLAHALADTGLTITDANPEEIGKVAVTVTPILDKREGEAYAHRLAQIVQDELDDLIARHAARRR